MVPAGKSLRTELIYRERHGAKNAARIIVLQGGTFLFGNAILGCLHQQLCGTHDPYDRKNSQRNRQISAVFRLAVVKAKRRIKAVQHAFGKIVLVTATTATVAIRDLFHDLRA